MMVLLPLQAAQRPQFRPPSGCVAGVAGLAPADVQIGTAEVHLIPAQIDKLTRPQAVPVGDQDHGRIAVAVAVVLGGIDQPLHLLLSEMLARAQFGIWLPQRRLPLWGDSRLGTPKKRNNGSHAHAFRSLCFVVAARPLR